MQFKNTTAGFGFVAILMHWIMAILMLTVLGLGLYMTRLKISEHKLVLYGWHKELGVLVLMLLVLRVIWRLSNITPSLSALPDWERLAARGMHLAFYGFMIVLPLTGWLISSAAGLPVSFFGLFTLPDLMAPSEKWLPRLAEIHEWLAYGFIVAVAGHTGAALKHYFINKDDILRRMLWP